MAGFVYECSIHGSQRSQPIAMVYHLWDGDESESPDDVADVFENNHIPDLNLWQTNQLTWSRIAVVPLDVGNLANPINRLINLSGAVAGDDMPTGVHIWAKFQSDDNGFKSGGKLVPGQVEANYTNGIPTAAHLATIQTNYDDLITDLVAAGLSLAIYRPTLSTPGFPSISTCSTVFVRGGGTNNRRQQPFQK